jgi:hypothetical protein
MPMFDLVDSLALGGEPCHDSTGALLAYCRRGNGTVNVDMPDLASFSYECGSNCVQAIPYRALSHELLLETYQHCVLPLILPALGVEVLHASAVAAEAGVAAFCAESGVGKSTLAVALGQRGYPIWADDAVAVDLAERAPMAVRLPFTLRLRPESASFLWDAAERGSGPATTSTGRPAFSLAALCMLRRIPEAPTPVAVERLGAAQACQAALAHAYCFSAKDATLRRRTIRNYLSITAQVPTYEIWFRPGREHLSALLDAVEEIVGDAPIAAG